MPKLKTDEYNVDFDELENTEYTEGGSFTSYDGDVPAKGTILRAYVRKMWWTLTALKPDGSGEDAMIKVLVVASSNEGDTAEYNGCPFWESLALNPQSKWKWQPFLDQFGITLRDIKTKTMVADEDDNVGAPIEKIGNFIPGENSDAAWCRVVTDRSRYNGEWSAHVGSWLDYEDDGEPEEPGEPG